MKAQMKAQMKAAADPNAAMRQLLTDAGIEPGMRVLDLGCGAGRVTRVIGELVGGEGQVVGMDRNARALAKASDEAAELGLSNLSYVEADLCKPLPSPWAFDAAVARRVLMYLPDPRAALRSVREALRPGGLVVLKEMDASAMPIASTPLALHDRVHGWIWKTIAGEGGNLGMGKELAPLLVECGFAVEHARAQAIIEGQSGSMAAVVQAIVPRILAHTDVSEAEIEVETLAQRLRQEREPSGATYVGNLSFEVWARKT